MCFAFCPAVLEDWESISTFGRNKDECDSENSDIQCYSDDSSSTLKVDFRSSTGASVVQYSEGEDEEISDKLVKRQATMERSRKRIPRSLQLASTPIRHKVL